MLPPPALAFLNVILPPYQSTVVFIIPLWCPRVSQISFACTIVELWCWSQSPEEWFILPATIAPFLFRRLTCFERLCIFTLGVFTENLNRNGIRFTDDFMEITTLALIENFNWNTILFHHEFQGKQQLFLPRIFRKTAVVFIEHFKRKVILIIRKFQEKQHSFL